jgi:hypothetical protein
MKLTSHQFYPWSMNSKYCTSASIVINTTTTTTNERLNGAMDKPVKSTTPVMEAARHSSVLVELLEEQLSIDCMLSLYTHNQLNY